MALMERIVRPHVPVDTGPSKTTSKCHEDQKNQVLKLAAPGGVLNYNFPSGGGFTTKDPPKVNTQQKTKNSSWSYAYKRYMTKVEKEQDKCDEDGDGAGARIVGGQVTDKPTGKSGDAGPGSGPGSGGPPPAAPAGA